MRYFTFQAMSYVYSCSARRSGAVLCITLCQDAPVLPVRRQRQLQWALSHCEGPSGPPEESQIFLSPCSTSQAPRVCLAFQQVLQRSWAQRSLPFCCRRRKTSLTHLTLFQLVAEVIAASHRNPQEHLLSRQHCSKIYLLCCFLLLLNTVMHCTLAANRDFLTKH